VTQLSRRRRAPRPPQEASSPAGPSGFTGLGIAPGLMAALDQLRFNEPTPIQLQSIPLGLEGTDLIAIAQTGTGKTLAFGIPMLQRLARLKGRGLVLLPTRELALQVDEAIRAVRKGKLITTGQLRRRLAEAQKADSTCPMTLGIFLRIISEVAEEDRQKGKKRITPYWRVVKDDGSLNPKLAGGVEAQAA